MISDICKICNQKIDEHNDDWADIGPEEKATFTVHLKCIGLGGLKDRMQDSVNDAMWRNKNR